jgi:hypothetical protein
VTLTLTRSTQGTMQILRLNTSSLDFAWVKVTSIGSFPASMHPSFGCQWLTGGGRDPLGLLILKRARVYLPVAQALTVAFRLSIPGF